MRPVSNERAIMPPKVRKADENVLAEYGFEFSAPPAKSETRRSKHDDRWQAARDICMAYPGNSIKVMAFDQASSAYSTAKAINNGEHRMFKDGQQGWTAVAGKDTTRKPEQTAKGNTTDPHAIWLTYTASE